MPLSYRSIIYSSTPPRAKLSEGPILFLGIARFTYDKHYTGRVAY